MYALRLVGIYATLLLGGAEVWTVFDLLKHKKLVWLNDSDYTLTFWVVAIILALLFMWKAWDQLGEPDEPDF